ncbi:MAG TPA: enoyl-CoA hydratase/isomerase family protein [Deltaproteobacteria bacterium]|jgi:enoyl-CoA hydratase/carnithine racemase|nr:enoyl-CoA hydratase/isomerase family protein [Deltaproteobacteria bacterium]HRW81653.1 enoyl-CoA hydratase/isomerase family protein [Desulfomonilia bacterium]NMD40422.1 enoyl-CoA hydratase/isomerase family protein [Deltaproteobacteria bacterium]HNQ86924.1 enoyl-CoA hydratase/isomerase family protein [Deltaproteobacteria bacterium]HNS88884.1 enoyl-CoA hydratase/isomerase family protein [Deltaproteobacteria bacterium]
MGNQFIRTDVRGQIAVIEMNRKHELNALSFGMMKEIHQVFGQFLQDSSDVRVLILTGGDECFSAGIDLKEAPYFSSEDAARYFHLAVDVYSMLLDQDKILISAVSGIAFGGGFNLALMGDMIIASESAIFAHPEIKYGFNPLLTPLVSRIGLARTRELALRGDPIGAREAYDFGLVNRVVEPERFRDEVMTCAKQLVGRSPEVVKAVKRSLDVVSRLDAKAALEYELEMTAMLFNIRGDIRDKMKGVIKTKGHEETTCED